MMVDCCLIQLSNNLCTVADSLRWTYLAKSHAVFYAIPALRKNSTSLYMNKTGSCSHTNAHICQETLTVASKVRRYTSVCVPGYWRAVNITNPVLPKLTLSITSMPVRLLFLLLLPIALHFKFHPRRSQGVDIHGGDFNWNIFAIGVGCIQLKPHACTPEPERLRDEIRRGVSPDKVSARKLANRLLPSILRQLYANHIHLYHLCYFIWKRPVCTAWKKQKIVYTDKGVPQGLAVRLLTFNMDNDFIIIYFYTAAKSNLVCMLYSEFERKCYLKLAKMSYLTESLKIEILMMIGYGDRARTQCEVVRLFRETHPDLPPLNQGTISKIEAHYLEMGHVRKVPSKRQAVVDDDTKLNLLLALEENPITPARKLARDMRWIPLSTSFTMRGHKP
ncbi:hypothetical protein NQ318_012962 [Aromia moschata]|uniref:DUF4817 domain-containing protein n=1 Tax=Aromia moschata TaxID=1265417 RepID=A0AAV8XNU6_9CUCU|nr:hypothetical protein NQ318_012962 [Aromia moschata]